MGKNKDNDFLDSRLANLDSILINRKPRLNDEVSNKNYMDDELDKNTILRLNQTVDKFLKVRFGNDIYSLIKYDKKQITDTTITKAPNMGGYLLQNWNIICNDKNGNGKKTKLYKIN